MPRHALSRSTIWRYWNASRAVSITLGPWSNGNCLSALASSDVGLKLPIHGTTKQQVGKVFAEAERAVLGPLPSDRFPSFQEARRIVSRDGHVEVAKAYYSAPPEYLGRTVWARWDARLVRIFNSRMEQIAVHVRQEPGQFSTLGEHLVAEKISGIERCSLAAVEGPVDRPASPRVG